jgi:NitT/TauT family transport system substrate-binding protein
MNGLLPADLGANLSAASAALGGRLRNPVNQARRFCLALFAILFFSQHLEQCPWWQALRSEVSQGRGRLVGARWSMSAMTLRHFLRLASLAVPWGIVAALPSGPAAAQTAVKLSIDARLDGPSALFLLPHDKGYYRSEGLEVSLDEGATFLDPITRVASGACQFGFADINALIRYRDQNPAAPVKAVFMVFNKPPFAIVGRKSRGIGDPKSLEDKRLGASPTGATYDQWPIFAKLNDIDMAKVTVEKIGVAVRTPMLAAGEIDASLGFSYRLYVDIKQRGVPLDDVVMLQMANYGLKLYGNAILVNSKFAAEHPESVQGFLHAFTRGLKDTIRNPLPTIESLLKRDGLLNKEVELERLRMAIRDNVMTPEVRTSGVGAIDGERLAQSIAQIAIAHSFKAKPKPEDIFDPAFLPAAAERKLN